MPRVAEAELLTDIMLTVFRLNGRVLEAGDRLVAPLGLTSARWQLLGAVALAGQPQSAPKIAETMGITRQGAQKQLHRLQGEGLFESLENPRHERSPLYALTEQGSALYQQAMNRHRQWSQRLAENLDGQELLQALQTLRKVEQCLLDDTERTQ